MRAMVLAAGRGERLRPLTDRIPKPLIPVAGKPLIHYTLSFLKNSGVDEVVINLHHLGGQIQDYVGNGSPWGLSVIYSIESELLGTGGGIQKASPHLAYGPFLVLNADVLVELDLNDVLRFHCENNALVTMVLRKDPDVERFGVIEVDGYHRVRQIAGRARATKGPWKRFMFTGVHILGPEVFSYMPFEASVFSIIDVYVDMIQAGLPILGYEMKGFWADFGTPERYAEARERLERGDPPLERVVSGSGFGG